MCVCLRETVLADVCILAGWTVFAFESMSMHACTKGDASLCTHPSIIPSHLCLTRSSRVKDASSEGLSAMTAVCLCPFAQGVIHC